MAGIAFIAAAFLLQTVTAQGPPCAQVLLLVAHPDDETLFAGEALLGRVAALPGGCRRAAWHVVCVTNGDVPQRRQDFRRALIVARMHGLAAEVTEEVWDFTDCNLHHCEHFYESASGVPFGERLHALLAQRPWDFVVTHNEQGEYHHIQHVGLHRAVRRCLESKSSSIPPRLLVFNPLPELNVSLSLGKQRMVKAYLTGQGVARPRILLFDALTKYAEHLIPAESFCRPLWPLGLGYFVGATHQGSLHFQYGWALARGQVDMGELGDFSAEAAFPLVQGLLHALLPGVCTDAGLERANYPATCAALREHLAGGGAPLRHLLLRMEMPHVVEVPTVGATAPRPTALEASPPGEAPAGRSLRCLLPAAQQPGELQSWKLRGGSGGPLWLELLAIRPILVGWRQGYRGQTYKILGSTGPLLLDLAPGEVEVPHRGARLELRPHDVLGWGVFAGEGVAGGEAAGDGSGTGGVPGAATLGPRCLTGECDEAGLCVFSSQVPVGVTSLLRVDALTVEVRPRAVAVPRGSARAPYAVRPALDISEHLAPEMSYEELLTMRQRLDHEDLGLFEDKLRLRRELLPQVGVASTPSIHLSRTDTQVLRHLVGRRGFVVKPAHMSESQFVFVVQDGVNLLQQAWGHPQPQVTATQIQEAVDTFMTRSALDWECRALVAARPGVIVEELVLAEDAQGKLRVDEYKFFLVWGEVVFAENVPFSSGAAMEIARDGQVLTAKVPCPPFCVPSCYGEMVHLAERVAQRSLTDFLRVDILVRGRCSELFVSEVELFPASDFSQPLKDVVARRWLEGYGV